MKRTDIAMIVLIAAVSAGIAYFVASGLFGGKEQTNETVQTIDVITSEVQKPDAAIFNKDAINPSVEVNVNDTGTDTTTTTTNSASTTP